MKKIIPVIFLLAFLMVGIWGATQWVAYLLHYSASLGKPWFIWDTWPIYKPFSYVEWFQKYGKMKKEIFNKGFLAILSGSMLGMAVCMLASRKNKPKAISNIHGSSRWSTPKEIKEMGLLEQKGVVLGKTEKGQYIRHDGPEHILVFAPTRSGKGIGLVIPTLLSWTGSILVNDIKGENWALTAGWRSKFSHCIYFDPTNLQSACFNPLLEVRKGEKEVKDAQNIADILVDPEGSNIRRDHWAETAHSLLVAAILHVLYAEPDKTLSGVANFLTNPKRTIYDSLMLMLHTKHLGADGHPVVVSTAREMLNKAGNELSGVVSTAMSYLSLYRDPVIAHVTKSSDFRIEDLMQAESPVSLYFVVPPSDISRTRPLIRLILSQIGRGLTEKISFKGTGYKHRLLLLIDEFPALGRLDFLESALAYIAGYGIKAFLIAQSLNQLDKHYSSNNAIMDNSHVRITFAANDERTAKRISNMLGTTTLVKKQKGFSGKLGAFNLSHINVSEQEIGRPLLTPDEIMTLPESEEIIFIAGQSPIKAKKVRYYEDEAFSKRIEPAPPLNDGAYEDRPPERVNDWADEGQKEVEIPMGEMIEEEEGFSSGDSDDGENSISIKHEQGDIVL